MTWHYTYDYETNTGNVWNHNGQQVATDYPIEGTGVPSSFGNAPDFVRDVMMQEAVAEFQANGWSNELLLILRDAIFEQFEEGPP